MMRSVPVLVCVLLISACNAGSSGGQRQWVREGASVEDFEQARDACGDYVRANFNPHQAFDSPMMRSTRAEVNQNRRRAARQMFARCMNERGFELVVVEGDMP